MEKQKHLHMLAKGNLEDAKMLSLQDGVETVDSGPTPNFDIYSEEYKMTVSNN